jgi:hypothetical protein
MRLTGVKGEAAVPSPPPTPVAARPLANPLLDDCASCEIAELAALELGILDSLLLVPELVESPSPLISQRPLLIDGYET